MDALDQKRGTFQRHKFKVESPFGNACINRPENEADISLYRPHTCLQLTSTDPGS